MAKKNQTMVSEFILVGLTENPELQSIFFIVLLWIYIITVFGNLFLIIAYRFSPNLQTPMYFFLANFSFLDICYISSTVPKMLSNLISGSKTISFSGCILQLYSFGVCGGTECYVLAAMAYDRYNAICHPLLYTAIMNRRTCLHLIAGSWVFGIVNIFIHTVLTFQLPFCDNKINQVFCDIPPLLKLSCIDTWTNEIVIFCTSGLVILCSFILIILSYIKIISSILTIHSTTGTRKAFSTCTSHLIVVTIFYGSIIFVYLKPKSSYATYQDQMVAVMYTVVAPFLNPFIYSLRNSEVKNALAKIAPRCGTEKH
ncbi:PREDICTED: olfactory receptor 998-like [Nanorana parkeri]|uniref:olfactory receptor 998-like n=1 Tax=Nanorana parkeri TaxID=125878 RepID=UPI0008540D00|nr:PREDICTED: olfactory receptor 998-like [Nanorana parkeri]